MYYNEIEKKIKIIFSLTDGVSIIICCYNSEITIHKTISHLLLQKIRAPIKWEILLIDNNCNDKTVQIVEGFNSQFGEKLRILKERTPGLASARIRGVNNSKYDLAIFCDDDNYLDENFVQNAYDIMKENHKIGICIGQNIALYEERPEEWFFGFEEALAIGNKGASQPRFIEPPQVPWGAGMVFRKDFYKNLIKSEYKSFLTDRKGSELSSGGDTEIAYLFRMHGYQWYYSPKLKLRHHIMRDRTSLDYLRTLYVGFGSAELIIKKHFLDNCWDGRINWKGYFLEKRILKKQLKIALSQDERDYKFILDSERKLGFLEKKWENKKVRPSYIQIKKTVSTVPK